MRVWTDSSAALGICSRQGLGKLRHIDIQTLWIQEKVRTKQIVLKKVRGEVNPADLLTKHLNSKEKVDQLVKLYGLVFMSGRAKSAPLLRRKAIEDTSEDFEAEDLELIVMDYIDEARVAVMPEAVAHDIAVWPHMYPEKMREAMFPTAVAVPSPEDEDQYAMGEHARLHQR